MYEQIISDAAFLYAVPEDWIRAFITVESSWNPSAVNPLADARGLMQIIPATAAGYGITDLNSLFDPAVNIDVGTHLLGDLRSRFGDSIEQVASAYYSGSGTAYQTNSDVAAYVQKIKTALGSTAAAGGGLIILFVGILAAAAFRKK